MLSTSAPQQSLRKLARQLGLNKFTVWRWLADAGVLKHRTCSGGGRIRDRRSRSDLPAGVPQRLTGMGPTLRRSAERRKATPVSVGGPRDARAEDDEGALEMAAFLVHPEQ